MIPTYTNQIKREIIESFLGSNLVVALVNYPNAGLSDTPTTQELAARKNFGMTNVFNTEIGRTNMNGYARQIVEDLSIETLSTLTKAEVEVSFTAEGGNFDPFTHIVLIKDADLSNADPATNGNNRGSTVGSVIYIEPVNNQSQPLILTNNLTFNYSFSLNIASQLL